MARLMWPDDHEWIYLTLDLLRGRIPIDPPPSDATRAAVHQGMQAYGVQPDQGDYMGTIDKNGQPSKD